MIQPSRPRLKRRLSAAVATAALMLWPSPPASAAEKLAEEVYADVAGRRQPLPSGEECRAVALIFVARECPMSNGYAPEIGRLCKEFTARGFLPGYAPGMTTKIAPADKVAEGATITLGKGLDIVLQMHYHPIGREVTDQPPKRNPNIILMANNDVDIPAGEKAHRRADAYTVPVDFEVQNIWGHMHMIGKGIRVWADLPDGTKKDLLRIHDWDFNWQDTYFYKKPFTLPKGTVVNSEWLWDNTADNPRNPNHPPKRVTLGEGSTDEMTGLIIGGMTAHPGLDEGIMWLTVLGHYLEVEKKAKDATAERLKRDSAAR